MTVPQPCVPDMLPLDNLDWRRIAKFASRAMLALARYDGTLDGMVNAAVLLSPITNQEAVLSSRIEGTQASMSEVLQHEAGEQFDDAKYGDIREVMNYRRALLMAENILRDRPISLALVRELHAVLMADVRGADQTPGAFRITQNWIGERGTPIEQARYIPPSPLIMQGSLDNLDSYIAMDDSDPLVQLAVVHAQFEIIHPFNDGNGRLGRMLIPLLLFQKSVLQRPVFYFSECLGECEDEYRDLLLGITKNADWQSWIEFFLRMIHEQAVRNIIKAKKIHELYDRMKVTFADIVHSQYTVATLDAFFNKPIINSSAFLKDSGIENRGTANTLLRRLTEAGVIHIHKAGSGRTPTIYVFPQLINITEGRNVL